MSDIYLQPANGKADIDIQRNGNPVMTGGLDNAVYLSLFVGPWWINRIETADLQYRGEVAESAGDLLSLTTARNVVEAAEESLEWMVDRSIAAEIEVDAEIPTRDRLNLRVVVSEPGDGETESRFTLSWAQLRADLAEGRR